MKLNTYGPLLVWMATFAMGAAIKTVAFHSDTLLFDVGPDGALWAAGIFFSLAVSSYSHTGVRVVESVSRKATGIGIEIDYTLIMDKNPGDKPKLLYLFLGGIAVWVFVLLTSGLAQHHFSIAQRFTSQVRMYTSLSIGLAILSVAAAVHASTEATR